MDDVGPLRFPGVSGMSGGERDGLVGEHRTAEVTLLNSMAGDEPAGQMDRHVAWSVRLLDLKDRLFGKRVLELTDDEAAGIAAMADERGLEVYCLSTDLFGGDLDAGEGYGEAELARAARAVELAGILDAKYVRLLAGGADRTDDRPDCASLLACEPWIASAYAEAARLIADAGLAATVENEVGRCILRTPADVKAFFDALGPDAGADFTWDVQNLWQMGTFPSMEVYRAFADRVGYLHLKGGQCEPGDPDRRLRWRSSLAEADWPVAEITRAVLADGRVDAVCLNPSHGQSRVEGRWEDFTELDLHYIRSAVEGLA